MPLLKSSQLRRFYKDGFLIVRDCFSRATALKIVEAACRREGWDLRDRSSGSAHRIKTRPSVELPIKTFAPKAWAALCELVGGEERIDRPDLTSWLDEFHVKFPHGSKSAWPADLDQLSWHKDGGPDIPHYLDSAEMGLLVFALWSDVSTRGGGTLLSCDSIATVARYLAARPQGASVVDIEFYEALQECRRYVEFRGQPGDVALLHPYMVHAETPNLFGPPRFQTVSMVKLKRPMCFDRPEGAHYSPVERSILRALGVERLEFARRKGRVRGLLGR